MSRATSGPARRGSTVPAARGGAEVGVRLHEIWHLLVVLAVVAHDATVGATLLPLAG